MKADTNHNKIKTLGELTDIVRTLRRNGETIVQCHGVFDLLHPGHIRHLAAAKCEGDRLIVTVTADRYVGKGPGRPVFNQRLRAESIAAIQNVDYVLISEWPRATEIIKTLKPDVYVKGNDYVERGDDLSGGIYEEEAAVKSGGGRIHFTDEIAFSSANLLNRHFDVYPEAAEEFLGRYRQNHSADDIIKQFDNLKKMKVLLVGDAIVDEYHYCGAMGKSSKGTSITARYLEEESFAGGVLAAANHIAGFCEDVHLVTCLGEQNSRLEFISSHLKPNIRPQFFYRPDVSTVVKRRFVDPAFLAKMFEICYLDDAALPPAANQEVCQYLAANVPEYDLVLVADFGHGFITEDMIDILCRQARFLAVNAQSNSANAGFNLITRYPRADYICIDEPEARLACHDRYSNLEDIALNLAGQLHCQRMVITHGNYDTITYAPEEGFHKIPIFSTEVVDTIGAGDAFISITSPFAAMAIPMETVGLIGNAVGALAVRIVCNRDSVEPVPLFRFITALLA